MKRDAAISILSECAGELRDRFGITELSLFCSVARDEARDTSDSTCFLRNLEVIGEAAKRVSDDVRSEMPDVPWRASAGCRDFVAHVHSAAAAQIGWEAVQQGVRKLRPIGGTFLRAKGSRDVPA